jgi:methionyl-tRNA formyltransferase
MRSVFMGSPEYALPALETLAQLTEVAGVVTQPDRPAGRGREPDPPPVKVLAQKLGLPVVQPEKLRSPEALEQLRAWRPEVIVVAAFGKILRPEVLNLPDRGCLNLHASLLPRHRGAAPVAAAILAGDAETGVSLMRMDPGLDTGPVLAQRRIPIRPDDTGGSLTRALAELAGEILRDCFPVYIRGELVARPQEDSLATYAPQLKKEDGKLDFHEPAEILARRVRAYQPWPGTFVVWRDAPLKILAAETGPAADPEPIGTVRKDSGLPAVRAADGWIILRTVQPAGKRPMPGDEFLRGARGFLGTVLT